MSERFVEILRKTRSFPMQKSIWKSREQCRYHSVSRFRTALFRLPERKIFLRVCFRKDLPEDVFAAVQSGFEKALSRAAAFLIEQGFANAEEIQKRILQKGGIHYLRSETG